MKAFMWKTIILAAVVGLSQLSYGSGETGQVTRDPKAMTAAELEKAGDGFRAQKDYERAIQYFREALRKDKKNAVLYNKLGLSQFKSGDRNGARAAFEKAAKMDKKFADAVNNVGAVYFIENNLGQATKYFKKAVALEETRATFHVNLGEAWFGQSKLDRAMNEFARALELDPEVLGRSSPAGDTARVASPEERAQFYYMLAKVQAKRGNVQECLLCLKKAKEIGYPNLAGVYKDEEFSQLWNDGRLAEIVPPPK